MAVQTITTTKVTANVAASPGTGKLLAIMGPSTSGAYDTPIALSRATDIQAMFGQGPLVEAACYAVQNPTSTVICLRTHATTAGVVSAVTATRAAGTPSTSVVTVDGASLHLIDCEFGMIVVKVILANGTSAAGGTLGTDHIYVQWTVDNFRTLSPVTKLPDTSTFVIELANTVSGFDSGIQLDCAAGTLNVGDLFTGTQTAPAAAVADLATANIALGNSALSWEGVLLASEITDATPSTGVCGAMDTFINGLMARGLFRWWMGNTSLPTVTAGVAQTDSAYQASTAITHFGAYSSAVPAAMNAGAALVASGNPTWPAQYILPPSYAIAPFVKSLPIEVSCADKTLGGLPGVSITDGNRNPLARCHDESLTPGLDDLRFMVLRSWTDAQGAFVNLPTLIAQNGSPFSNFQRLRVWCFFATTVWSFFNTKLQKGVDYDLNTGHILKSVADRIEELANTLIRTTLVDPHKCTAALVSVLRTDDLRVNNPTLTVEGGIQPLAYPTFINLRLGFLLPG